MRRDTVVARDIRLRSAEGMRLEPAQQLEQLMSRFGVPGVSVAVVDGGRLAWARGWGAADATRGVTVTDATLFQAGSISKPVAAMCALRLVARGELDLDADVNERLVSWKVPPNEAWQPRVTLRQLLAHTAGLTVHGFPGYSRDRKPPTLVEILDGTSGATSLPVRVRAIPGLQFSYSGGGYCVLQQLLVDVTGTPFPDLARDLVLAPLGMDASGYEQPLPDAKADIAATGHRTAGKPVAGGWHVYPEMAAAGLWTTPSDLARFVIAIQDACAERKDAVLPPRLVGELLTPGASNNVMGLGLLVEGAGNAKRFHHGGDDEGFVAFMVGYAHAGLGAVVMTNSDSGVRIGRAVVEAVAREYAWPDFPEPAAGVVSATDAELAAACATYVSADGHRFEIERSGRSLELRVPSQPPLALQPLGGGRWAIAALDATVAFEPSAERPERLVISQRAEYMQDVVAVCAAS